MRLSGWQRAWIVCSVIWMAYWLWVTRGMSFDSGDAPFVARVMLAPPLLLYVAGWVIARLLRFIGARRGD